MTAFTKSLRQLPERSFELPGHPVDCQSVAVGLPQSVISPKTDMCFRHVLIVNCFIVYGILKKEHFTGDSDETAMNILKSKHGLMYLFGHNNR